MVDAHDARGSDDELAPRHLLEAHTVPELPYDFTDRVLGSLHAASVARVRTSRPALPWVVAACSSAVALAATLLLVLMWKVSPPASTPAPIPAVASTGAPTPIPVVGSPVPAAAPQLGHLVLAVEPAVAIVRVDGARVAGPSPFIATNLVPGPHTIEIESEGHAPWTRELDVPIGTLDLSIALASTMTPPPSRSANPDDSFIPDSDAEPGRKAPFSTTSGGKAVLRIGVNAGAAPAQVFVDGKLMGTTPIANARVEPGRHKVKWKWSSGHEVTKSIDVAAGETKVVKAG